MAIHRRSGHFHRASDGARPWGLNRGDILVLLCGLLGFFAFTFLPGILTSGVWSGHFGTSGTSQSDGTSTVEWRSTPATQRLQQILGPMEDPTAPVTDSAPAAQEPPSRFPVAAPPTRILYPAAGMDVLIHPLQPSSLEVESQTIEPPATMDGYWLTPFGMPGAGSTNATYIVGHSWTDRDAPFNHLSSAAHPGDEFVATTASGTMNYRVDSVTTYLKSTLKDSPIWTVVPDRIVLISCYTEDPWGRNVVVIASPVSGT